MQKHNKALHGDIEKVVFILNKKKNDKVVVAVTIPSDEKLSFYFH